MNERFEDLMYQAGLTAQGCWDEMDSYDRQAIEKFAELIVRECIGILSSNNPCPPGTTIMYSLLQDEYFDKGWQVAVETKSNQIKKHFGVLE